MNIMYKIRCREVERGINDDPVAAYHPAQSSQAP
jgi:hypothetical protein